MAKIDPNDHKTFEERIDVINEHIEHKRRSWTLTTMDFEDVKQIILIRVWKKYTLFDPSKAPFEHWLNTLITHCITNLLRDGYLRYSRPCIRDGGCVYNLGTGHCGYTKSGLQCSECALYKEWQMKKESEYNIKASLALEHHAQEVSNMQSDFVDIESKKKVIDEKMKKELGQWERKIYKYLYIDNLTPLETTKQLEKDAQKRKRPLRAEDAIEYQSVLKCAKMMKDMMLQIIKREDLI